MAIPGILQQLAKTNPTMGQIKQARAILDSMKDPQAALTQMINQNPMVNQVIRQYGGVDGAVNALCQQKGINPQEFMEALR